MLDKATNPCNTCAVSLICLSGRHCKYAYICSNCGGIWIDDIQTLVHCSKFNAKTEYDILPGCPACEPFEIASEKITKIMGYSSEEHQEEKGKHRAADEK